MVVYTINQKVFCVEESLHGLSSRQVVREFEAVYGQPAPTHKTETNWVKKFHEFWNMENRPKSGRPKIEPEVCALVRAYFEENEESSIRKAVPGYKKSNNLQNFEKILEAISI